MSLPASLFSAVEMAPRDPILGLNEQFALDANLQKSTSVSVCITTTTASCPC